MQCAARIWRFASLRSRHSKIRPQATAQVNSSRLYASAASRPENGREGTNGQHTDDKVTSSAKDDGAHVGPKPASTTTGEDGWLPNFVAIQDQVESMTQYKFNDPAYIKAALHRKDTYLGDELIPSCQQHLALIGDAALKLAYYSDNFPAHNFRLMNLQFERIASNAHLSRVAQTLKINELLQNVSNAFTKSTRMPRFELANARSVQDIFATGVEALVGAVFLDSGYDFHVVNRVAQLMLSSTPFRFRERNKKSTQPTSASGSRVIRHVRFTPPAVREGTTKAALFQRRSRRRIRSAQQTAARSRAATRARRLVRSSPLAAAKTIPELQKELIAKNMGNDLLQSLTTS